MKKVIFISALAIAAAVSCTKSDIVDTKFNEQISFETYTGRDAMTKATPYGSNALPDAVGVYGFYTGAGEWETTTNANLWANLQLRNSNGTWSYDADKTKYWTNAEDKYTFLAYAPYSAGGENAVLVPSDNANPTITYSVPSTISSQLDVMYANDDTHVDMVKPANNGSVNLQFKHALSRITVKAAENVDDYNYTIYGLSISGNFKTTGTLTLMTNEWNATKSATPVEYSIYSSTTGQVVPTPKEATDGQAAVTAHDFAGSNNYLMVIPVDFTGTVTEGEVTTYPNAATLTVTYTTTFDGKESNKMTKTVAVPTNFEQGKAYALNLVFEPNKDNAITFTVTVADWAAEESGVVVPSNPENGTLVTPAA